MLQLATLAAQGASEAPDLLITRAVERRLSPHTPQKLFPTGLAVTVAVPISTIANASTHPAADVIEHQEVDSRHSIRPNLGSTNLAVHAGCVTESGSQ
jgi:hypothetical protein